MQLSIANVKIFRIFSGFYIIRSKKIKFSYAYFGAKQNSMNLATSRSQKAQSWVVSGSS